MQSLFNNITNRLKHQQLRLLNLTEQQQTGHFSAWLMRDVPIPDSSILSPDQNNDPVSSQVTMHSKNDLQLLWYRYSRIHIGSHVPDRYLCMVLSDYCEGVGKPTYRYLNFLCKMVWMDAMLMLRIVDSVCTVIWRTYPVFLTNMSTLENFYGSITGI